MQTQLRNQTTSKMDQLQTFKLRILTGSLRTSALPPDMDKLQLHSLEECVVFFAT